MPDTNDLKKTMEKVATLEASLAAQRQVIKSLGLTDLEQKREMEKMETTVKEHNDSVMAKVDETNKAVSSMSTNMAVANNKLDQLMEFRSDMRSATRSAVGKGFQVFVAVITLLALATMVAMQAVK